MASLTDLRTMIQDRVASDEGLGELKYPVCLNAPLVDEYRRLQAERDAQAHAGKDRLSGADTSELNAQLDELADRIDAATIDVVFRALPGEKYQDVMNAHEGFGRSQSIMTEFVDDLMGKCYRHVVDSDGDKHDLDLKTEVYPLQRHGDFDAMSDAVIALNRDRIDLPTSRRR